MKTQSPKPDAASECPQAPGSFYWTINHPSYIVPSYVNPRLGSYLVFGPPHSLTGVFALTAKELMHQLRGYGWKPSRFSNCPQKLTRIELHENGFSAVHFDSYAKALEDDEQRMEKASKASRKRSSYSCPFCGHADRLRKTRWTHERPDGSEYMGTALICDRCDAVAPAHLWKARKDHDNKNDMEGIQ